MSAVLIAPISLMPFAYNLLALTLPMPLSLSRARSSSLTPYCKRKRSLWISFWA